MKFFVFTLSLLISIFILGCAADSTENIAVEPSSTTSTTAETTPKRPMVLLDSQRLLGKKPVIKRIEDLEMSQPTVIMKKRPKKKQIAEVDPQKTETNKMRVIKNETQPTIVPGKRPVAKTETRLVENKAKEIVIAKPIEQPKEVEKPVETSIDLSDFAITQPTLKQARNASFTDAKVYHDMVEYFFTDLQGKTIKIRIDNEPEEGKIIPIMPDNLLSTTESGTGKIPNPIQIGKQYIITYDSKGNAKTIMEN